MQPRRSLNPFPPSTPSRPPGELQFHNPAWFDKNQPNEATLLVGYLRLFTRKWLAVFLFAAAGALAAVGFTATRPRLYQARATIEIQGINGDYANIKSFDPTTAFQDYSPDGYLLTQAAITQSDRLLKRVTGRLLSANPKELLSDKSKDVTANPKSNLENAIADAEGSVSARVVSNTRILELTCDSLHPRLAAAFVNTWADEYINQNAEARVEVTQQTEKALRVQLEHVQEKLERAEEDLLAYARAVNLTFTGDEHQKNILEEKLQQIQTALAEAEKDRAVKQSQYEVASSAPLDTIPLIQDDQVRRDGENRLLDLRRELANLKAYMTPAHPKVQRVEQEIAEYERSLAREADRVSKRIANEYQEVQRREGLLKSTYDQENKALAEQSEKAIRYKILKREVDTNRALYESLLQKVKEAGVAGAMRANNVHLIDFAEVPQRPYKPKPATNLGIGLVVGLFAGVVFVVLRERADHSIRIPGEALSWLRVPELGAIPSAGSEAALSALFLPAGASSRRIAAAAPSGRVASAGESVVLPWSKGSPLLVDSFRATMASLLLCPEHSERIPGIVITSVGPGEGKSTVVCNLGVAMTETHRRVLLVDANLRHPQLHEIFQIANSYGLTDLLAEDDNTEGDHVRGAVRVSAGCDLFVLPAGTATGNVANLLYSARLPKLLDRLRGEFDAVLIDTPPMIQAPDARVLARIAGGVVLVIRAGQTSRDTAVAARRRFAEDGTAVIGAILNDWDVKATDGSAYKKYYRPARNHYNGNGNPS